jgi:hypothetical protein
MTPFEAANTAAEGVRALNHATIGPAGYTWPADVDAVIGELECLAHRLPQAFEQAARWLGRQHGEGLIGHDDGIDPEITVEEALGDLERAAREARELGITLESVRESTSNLTGLDPDQAAELGDDR